LDHLPGQVVLRVLLISPEPYPGKQGHSAEQVPGLATMWWQIQEPDGPQRYTLTPDRAMNVPAPTPTGSQPQSSLLFWIPPWLYRRAWWGVLAPCIAGNRSCSGSVEVPSCPRCERVPGGTVNDPSGSDNEHALTQCVVRSEPATRLARRTRIHVQVKTNRLGRGRQLASALSFFGLQGCLALKAPPRPRPYKSGSDCHFRNPPRVE